MSTPEQLAAQAAALVAVKAARIERDKTVTDANTRLQQAIRDAYDTGASVRNIAVAASWTPQRIYQLLGESH